MCTKRAGELGVRVTRPDGHERDGNGSSGVGMLDYMHARYCSPALGRFQSPDPVNDGGRLLPNFGTCTLTVETTQSV